MKVLIMSDTHRDVSNAITAIKNEGKIDMCLHLGDVEWDAAVLEEYLECPLYMVKGNNDFLGLCPEELEINIAGHKAFLTHGHRYLVNLGVERLMDEAASRGADIAIYGHTHKPIIWETDGMTVLCPGSISYPRQNKRKKTYIVMEVDDDGVAHYTLKKIE